MDRPVEDMLHGEPGQSDERPARPEGFLIQSARSNCSECWGCVRHCPARALRVVDDRTEVIEEKCVKCGLCVSECGKASHLVRDDTDLVIELLAGDRPVVAILATEFVAAMHPMTPTEVERALEGIGFYAVESTLLGEEAVALEYERLHARGTSALVLRSTCPVVVSWVQKFHASLVSALAPIVPPYVVQARLVKELYPPQTAVVYISPCYARKDEAYDPQFEGAIDAAIDFEELKRLIAHIGSRAAAMPQGVAGARRPSPVKEISLTDGFPRRTAAERDMTDTEVQVIRGLHKLDRLLAAIEAGESAPLIVDMLNCEGCIDGPSVRPGLSLFAKRNIVAAERRSSAMSAVSTRELLGHLPPLEVRRSFQAQPFIVALPTEQQIDEALAEGEFASREDTIDCGACGYPTCVEHAIAVLQGNSSWEMCFPLQKKRLSRSIEELTETAAIDPLTGLWNRRAFDERLKEEIMRSARYSQEVALLMIDLDGFKRVNDRYGHVAGDRVLKTVAEALRSNLRATDVPTRYGGDEFAVILPGIGKTEAFVVAEKLRAVVRERPIELESEGRLDELGVTASIGVASAWQGISEPIALLEAADQALYQAKQAGRDQVRIAAG